MISMSKVLWFANKTCWPQTGPSSVTKQIMLDECQSRICSGEKYTSDMT